MKSAVLATENTKASKVRLGDVVSVKARIGWQGLTQKEHMAEGEYQLVTGTDFKDGFVDFDSCVYVSKDRYDQDPYIQLKEGDLLLTKDGTIGKVAVVGKMNKPATLNSGVFVIRDLGRNFNLRYLYHFFLAPEFRKLVDGKLTGCTIAHLNQKILVDLRISLPSLAEQKRIAAELDLFTEMIRNREAQLARLDTLVKAKFEEMFGRLNSEKRKLSCGVEEMFIGPFGSALKNECFVEENEAYCVVYEQKHAIHKNIKFPFRFVNRDKYEELKRFSVFPGDIIVSCRGTVGEVFVVPEKAPLGIMHPSIMKIRLKESVFNKEYFLFMLSSYMQETQHKANGSSIKMAITATALGNELFPFPLLSLQKEFAAVVEEVDKSKAAIRKTIENLKTLYKARLQEYFA